MAPSSTIVQLPSLSLLMPSSSRMSSGSPPLHPSTKAAVRSSAPTVSPSSSSALRDEHALLAAFETRPTRPKRSSSERSKEFRAKRKKYEGELQQQVDALQREVAELTMRRNIWQEKLVHVRSNVSGSLIKVVREYYLVFQHGLALAGGVGANPKAKYQIDFLHQAMDPDVRVNDCVGIPALVELWRQYTTAHANLFVEVGDVTHFGPDEDPIVLLSTKVHAQLSHATMEIMFPTAFEHDGLAAKFVGKQVTYEARTLFRFNTDGRICSLEHDVDVFNAVLAVAPTVDDALTLMAHFQCTPLARWSMDIKEETTTKPSRPPLELQVKVEKVEITSAVSRKRTFGQTTALAYAVKTESPSSGSDSDSERRKHSMNFLLS
jgi:hypothetical protein